MQGPDQLAEGPAQTGERSCLTAGDLLGPVEQTGPGASGAHRWPVLATSVGGASGSAWWRKSVSAELYGSASINSAIFS